MRKRSFSAYNASIDKPGVGETTRVLLRRVPYWHKPSDVFFDEWTRDM
ncbi:hypothetical protein KW850_21935 [Bacillus sp. sid0103]|nr:hypothetical protein [Bacillus sp. sid0103]